MIILDRIKVCIPIFLFFLLSCTHEVKQKNPAIMNASQVIPSQRMQDGGTWTTTDLSIHIPGAYCAESGTYDCHHGRWYTWEAAKQGCDQIGDNWRLPTNAEWAALAKAYGGVYDDSNDEGKSAFQQLGPDGNSGFHATLRGNREINGDFQRQGDHGFYWTSTEVDSAEVWFYNFAKGASLLDRHSGDKNLAMSVRCILDDAN